MTDLGKMVEKMNEVEAINIVKMLNAVKCMVVKDYVDRNLNRLLAARQLDHDFGGNREKDAYDNIAKIYDEAGMPEEAEKYKGDPKEIWERLKRENEEDNHI